MIRPIKNIKYLILSLLLFNSGLALLSQSQKDNQNRRTLQSAIEFIESNSDYIFNYDPSMLKGYSYPGTIDLLAFDNTIERIFYDSPFNFEIDAQTRSMAIDS